MSLGLISFPEEDERTTYSQTRSGHVLESNELPRRI